MVTDPLYPWKRAISEELRKHVSMVTGPLYPWKIAISQEIKKYVSLVTGPHYSCQLRMREVISWMKPLELRRLTLQSFYSTFCLDTSWRNRQGHARCWTMSWRFLPDFENQQEVLSYHWLWYYSKVQKDFTLWILKSRMQSVFSLEFWIPALYMHRWIHARQKCF